MIKRLKLLTVLTLALLIGGASSAYAQKGKKGYDIKVTFNGLKDTTIMLAYYFEDKQYVKDTVRVNSKGVGHFTGDEPLQYGLYIIADHHKRYFEVLIHEDQFFEVEADYQAPDAPDVQPYVRSLKIKGSELNDDFHDFQYMQDTVGVAVYQIDTFLKNHPDLPQSTKDSLAAQKQALYDIRNNFPDKYSAENPESFLTTLFMFNKGVEWPDDYKDWEQIERYYYYRDHFFDNADFTEEGLVRTPFFYPKVKQYYDLFNSQPADTIIKYTDSLIARTNGDDAVFQYFVRYTLNKYDTTKRVCMEGVFVNVALKYYGAGKAYWLHDTVSAKFVEKAEKMKDLCCDKVAPNIVAWKHPDSSLLQLHQVDANRTILLFWTPTCSHCRHDVPAFFDLFKKYADKGIKVYAVCTEWEADELKKWRDFIDEKGLKHPNWINISTKAGQYPLFKVQYHIESTPQFYLLDENKKIILRRIGVDALKQYFEHEYGKTEEQEGSGPEKASGDANKPEEEHNH